MGAIHLGWVRLFSHDGSLDDTQVSSPTVVARAAWLRVWHFAVGAVTVAALEKIRGVYRVYNLEVEGDHEYLVGGWAYGRIMPPAGI